MGRPPGGKKGAGRKAAPVRTMTHGGCEVRAPGCDVRHRTLRTLGRGPAGCYVRSQRMRQLAPMIRVALGLVVALAACRFDLPDVVEPDGAAAGEINLWPASAVPSVVAAPDTTAVELGVKFRTEVPGAITGVRFYRGSLANEGPHTGRLWTAGGSLLASAPFESRGVGWQTVRFGQPVPIQPGTTYVASYFAPRGRYAADNLFFARQGHRAGPLEALADGADGGNGVFHTGGNRFPRETYMATNYWVDVLFVAGR